MGKLKIYKRRDYTNQESYDCFLKQHVLGLEPGFASVITAKGVDTIDGIMYVVRIVYNEIEDPNFEPIAKCWINGEDIYVWRDRCWAMGVDANGHPVSFECHRGLVLVLYHIGAKLEEDNDAGHNDN